MTALRKKLNSRRGATILLALLFLLLCMMVCASLLMAAVSNAGKARRNRVEQQKYLTLSSGLQLICQDLAAAKYQGQYTYTAEEAVKEGAEKDPTTGDYKPEDKYTIHTYTQLTGTYTPAVKALEPLRDDMDILFAKNFRLPSAEEQFGDEYPYKPLPIPDRDAPPKEPYQLTLKLKDLTAADYPGLGEETVTVTVQLIQATGVIRLTAALGGAPNPADPGAFHYTMEAELVPKQKPWEVLTLKPNPDKTDGATANSTNALEWTLSWIAKKEKEAEATP